MLSLNLGCGPRLFPAGKLGWINIDRVDMTSYLNFVRNGPDTMTDEQKLLKARMLGGEPVNFLHYDLRVNLPYDANSVDIILCGQLLEHLSPVEADCFLQDCYRILKRDGLLRVSVPDMELLAKAYIAGGMSLFLEDQPHQYTSAKSEGRKFAMILFGNLGVSSEYEGHKMGYDFEGLREVLEAVGFKAVEKTEYNKSRNLLLAEEQLDSPTGRSHSLYVEGNR